MRKTGLILVLVLTFLCASFVRAEDKKCYEKKALTGTWEGFKAADFFEDECPDKSMEMDVLETGGLMGTVYGFEDPYAYEIKIAGEWKIDCDKLISKTTKVNKVEISLDEDADLTEEQEGQIKSQIPALSEAIKAQMEKDPKFGEEQSELIIHLDDKFLITKDGAGDLYVYKKK